MKKLITVITFLIVIATTANKVNAQIIFQKAFGESDVDYGYSVQQTYDGGYVFAGATNNFGAGGSGSDVYVVKTDELGDTLWTRAYGGTNSDYARYIQQTTDSGYVIAGMTWGFGAGGSDFYLIKTEPNGNLLWSKTYGGTNNEFCFSVQETTDGGYVLGGTTDSYGAGNKDVYVIKTDQNGDTLWTRTYGGTDDDEGTSVQEIIGGGYIITGHTFSFGSGGSDIYLLKIDNNGDTIWTKTFGESGNEKGWSIQQTTDTGYVITGSSPGVGGSDVCLIKTSNDGSIQWAKTFGGSNTDYGYYLRQTADGGYIVIGQTMSFGDFFGDVYLLKVDSIGDTLWTRTYGGTNQEYAYSVQQTSDFGYIITARTFSYGAGDADALLIKTDANGNSGCYEYSTNTAIGIPAFITNTTATVTGSGGSVTSPVTISSSTTTKNDLCTTINVPEINNLLNRILLYPNPFSVYATIVFKNFKKEKHTLTIHDTQGRLVRTITNITTDKVTIDKDNLTGGLYFFQLHATGQLRATGKLMVE